MEHLLAEEPCPECRPAPALWQQPSGEHWLDKRELRAGSREPCGQSHGPSLSSPSGDGGCCLSETLCVSLQIQMYQLSRLLHDYHRDLYNHLEEHEIGPSLYAAPWFLTVFASQFPLGFVARVFGECV